VSLRSELRSRFEGLWRRDRADRDLDDELRFHLDLETEKHLRAGAPPAEARRRARMALGGATQVREEVHEARGLRWLDEATRDVRYALRQLSHAPAFATIAVATLALGIGANTAIFSVVDGVLLRSAPLADADRLVVVWQTDRRTGTTREPASWPDYLDFRSRTRTLADAAALTGAELTLTPDRGEPARLSGMAVTHGYFRLIGVEPILGRTFTADEDRPGGPAVALIGETLWRSRYAADPGVIGRSIRLNEEPRQIVGVLPASADFGLDQVHARAAYHAPYTGAGPVEAWAPLQASEEQFSRDTHPFFVLGRVAPGVGLDAARRELTAIAADLERTYPSNTARGVTVEPLTEAVFGPTRPMLYLLLAAVGLVLLVACVNVANLLLARGAARAREVAVRSALGAGIGRLGRQFAVETVVLTLLGALAGVGLAVAGLEALLALAPADIPRLDQVAIDWRVLTATLGVSVAVGLAFGLVPLIQSRRVDVVATIKGELPVVSGGRGRRRLREALVTTEIALAVVLVVSAGLLIRSFQSVLRVDPGFDAARVLKAEYQLPPSRYPRDFAKWPLWSEIHAFNTALQDRVGVIPGALAVAVAGAHPLDAGFTNSFLIVGREAEARDWPEISLRLVSPGYFATMGLRLQEGRALGEGDDARAPLVAVINATAASRFFALGTSPLGHEIRFWGVNRRIVGVVGDERIHGLTEPAPPAVYVALAQAPSSSGALLVRAAGDPRGLAGAVRAAIASVDPALAVYGVEPLAETLVDSVGQRRFAMLVLGLFAGLTLVLALVGIHGVLSYTTAQRTRELGIRAALGASRREVAGLVLRGGLALVALGIALGLGGAWGASRLLTGLLFGVTRLDPLTYLVVPVAVLLAASVATWVPVRRATRIDPIEALKVE
jgi:predicted permease